jgi:hypothetical protein
MCLKVKDWAQTLRLRRGWLEQFPAAYTLYYTSIGLRYVASYVHAHPNRNCEEIIPSQRKSISLLTMTLRRVGIACQPRAPNPESPAPSPQSRKLSCL